MKMNNEQKSKMTLPNKLTILRIILVIPFLACMISLIIFLDKNFLGHTQFERENNYKIIGRTLFAISGLFFVMAMITDFLDGHIARKRNLITEFGKLWDPIADKIIILSAMICLSALKIVPIWITLVFVLRDIIVSGIRVVMTKNNISVAAKKIGKIKTVFQTIGLVSIFIIYTILDVNFILEKNINNLIYEILIIHALNFPIIIAVILNIVSAFEYYNSVKNFI